MTARKFDIAITDDGGEKLTKLLTNAKFVRIVNSTKPTDVLQSELMLIRFMQALYGDDNYLKLEDHYDGNLTDMWKFTEGKLKTLGESAQAE
jgi:hypothetical protein